MKKTPTARPFLAGIFKIDLEESRVYGLDILRCVSILFVLLAHGSFILPKAVSNIAVSIVPDGVTIFFVLSGYLIGGILIRTMVKERLTFRTLRKFWIRRWFRTLPAYFLVLTVLVLLNLAFTDNFSLQKVIPYFGFSQNLHSAQPPFFAESWSLSVEEWFYLLVPVCIFVMAGIFKLRKGTSILLTALAVIGIITAFRLYRFSKLGLIDEMYRWELFFRMQVITRLDSLMFGIIGAYLAHRFPVKWTRYKVPLFAIGFCIILMPQLLIFPRFGIYLSVFSFSVNSLAVLCMLPMLSNLRAGHGLIYKAATCISLISYSMYLLHLSIIQIWLLPHLNLESLGQFGIAFKYILFWVLSILCSILLFKYFEMPAKRMGSYFLE